MCSLGSNWQYESIGSDNGLAPNKRQAIIWSNVIMLYWRICATPRRLILFKSLQFIWRMGVVDQRITCNDEFQMNRSDVDGLISARLL